MVWRKSIIPLRFLLNTARLCALSVAPHYYILIKAALKWAQIAAASFFFALALSSDSLPFSIKCYKPTVWLVRKKTRETRNTTKSLQLNPVFITVLTSVWQLSATSGRSAAPLLPFSLPQQNQRWECCGTGIVLTACQVARYGAPMLHVVKSSCLANGVVGTSAVSLLYAFTVMLVEKIILSGLSHLEKKISVPTLLQTYF